MSTPSYTTQSLEHLGLVAGFMDESGLVEAVDALFPNQSDNKHVSYGQQLKAMILNGLGFVSRTLHMYPKYYEGKALDRLIGEGVEASHLNDKVLGRCLDKFYEYGVSELYLQLASKVVNQLGLAPKSLHIDSTSFHVDGAYDGEETEDKKIKLVRGYSRDHRPELNQVILNLIVENQAGIPLFMKAASGNSSDKSSFTQLVSAHVKSLQAAHKNRYMVGDSALYTKASIHEFAKQGALFVTRAPNQLQETKALMARVSEVEFEPLGEGYSGYWHDCDYGGVAQKWLLIRSKQAKEREIATLKRQILKQGEQDDKDFTRLCKQAFACQADAQTALQRWQKKRSYTQVSEVEFTRQDHYQRPGRPAKEQTPDNYRYFITATLSTALSAYEQAAHTKGLFVITTNDCRDDWSMLELLEIYKSQQSVERGFRFLKSPDFLTSAIFLKKPERIEALLMVMTCCLMVYAAIEHRIRAALVMTNTFFPNLKNKPYQKPTARWVFVCFQDIHVLTVDKHQKIVVNLRDRHGIILNALGELYQKIYS
jgi:transposase